jgi:hypothetical protein
MRKCAQIAVALTAAATLGLSMPTAQAATNSHTDGTGDVWITTYPNDGGDPDPATLSSESVNVDLIGVTVTHGTKKVRAVASYVDLQKTGEGFGFSLQIQHGNDYFYEGADAAAGYWRGRPSFSSGQSNAGCKGDTVDIDYDANTISVSVPRTCIGKPNYIRYAAFAMTYVSDDTAFSFITDDARSDQEFPQNVSRRIAKG